MTSEMSIRRKYWKEHEPEKYKAYLEAQRIRSKERRDKKKAQWESGVHTPELIAEREKEQASARYKF